MENINIAELLKDCPKGMKLYSPLCGECYFDRLNMGTIICKKQNTQEIAFTSKGYFMLPIFDNCECMIFPSKENRDWSKFQRPFKDGDILATKNGLFIGIVKIENNIQINTYCTINALGCLTINTLYHFDRLATEEEKAKLFDTIKKYGYKWNAETKTLEKLNNPKFDIATLKPFDRVLTRANDDDSWVCNLYSYRIKDYYVVLNAELALQCIPYEQNKHLIGTTDDCDEFYKN